MNIYGLGSMWADEITKLLVGPFNWTTAEVKPVAGDLLIAFVDCSTEWTCPPGWTQNGDVVTRVMTPSDGDCFFHLLERGSMKLHLALGRSTQPGPDISVEADFECETQPEGRPSIDT